MGDNSALKIDWTKRTFLVVTGASRGLGKVIAIEFCKRLSINSCVLLIARDNDKLEKTKQDIRNISSVKTLTSSLDLMSTNTEQCELVLQKAVKDSCETHDFDQAILVRNAGSLGDVSKFTSSFTSQEIRDYVELNLLSVTFFSSSFLNVFREVPNRMIVNISSLAAVQPFKGWSLYCTCKAAADMYFRVLAEEDKSVVVLNYAPGPLKTDMLTEALEKSFPEIKAKFFNEEGECQALTCEYSVLKLIALLESANYKSGDHVDIFDSV